MGAEQLTIAALERWVLFGAGQQIVEISDRAAVIDLCSCTGGPVERRESRDPAVIECLRQESPSSGSD